MCLGIFIQKMRNTHRVSTYHDQMRKCVQKHFVKCRFLSKTLKGMIEVAIWWKWEMCKAFFFKQFYASILCNLHLAIRGSLINTLRKYNSTIAAKWTISFFNVICNFLHGRNVFKRQIIWMIMGEIFLCLHFRDKRLFLLDSTIPAELSDLCDNIILFFQIK